VLLIGRFELRRRIGAGGLAEVFSAYDRDTGAEIAIKLLHAHLALHGPTCERFRRELSIARSLDHPGIVRVFDVHQDEGRPFITMELLRGATLRERLLREGPLVPDEARRIVRDVCEALRAAHRQGVVHRDLKPENIFLTGEGAVKVLDFGLARVGGQSRLTAQGAVAGTFGYVAPEILAGEPGDARSDLFALGATWYEMLTGNRWCDSAAPVVDGDDADALGRALETDPELRFLEAGQFLRALDGRAVPPPPPAAPPLTAGDYDVLVHDVVRPPLPLRSIGRVLERLGARASLGWKCRLLGAGQAVLVSAASRRSAEAAAALCAAQGLPATVRAVEGRPRSEEWLARHGGWTLGLLFGLGAMAAAAALRLSAWWTVAGAAFGYMLSWGLRPPASKAPLSGLPAHASGLLRLAEGVTRRALLLRERRPDLVALASAAESAAATARAADSDPAVAQRLLEVAVSLDEALAPEAA
jgi:hypothetical protein